MILLQAAQAVERLYEFGILGIFAAIFLFAIWRLWDQNNKLSAKYLVDLAGIQSEHKEELIRLLREAFERDKLNIQVLDKIQEKVSDAPIIKQLAEAIKDGQRETHKKLDELNKP